MIHVFSKGYGIAVPLAAFPGFLIAELSTRAITHDDTYYYTHPEPILCGGLLAAVLVRGAVKLVEKQHPPSVEVDEVSGQERRFYRNDSFFFIPIRFWPYLVLVISVAVAFTEKHR